MRGTLRFVSGAWRLQIRVNGRFKTQTVHAPNTREGRRVAERALARMVLDHDAHQGAGGGEWTVAQWWDKCMRLRGHLAGWSQSTERTFTVYIHRHMETVWLHTLAPSDVAAFYAKLQAEPGVRAKRLSDASIRRFHNSFRAVLELAVKDQIIARNPAQAVTLAALPDPVVTPAKPEEVRALLAAAEKTPMLLAYVAVAANTGQRRGSLCALRWSDLDDGVLTVQRGWTRGPDGWTMRTTKTGSVVRAHLGPSTLELLDRWRDLSAVQHAECRLEPEWMFTRVPGEAILPTTMSSRMDRVREKAGVTATMKSMRPYFATSLLRGGTTIRTVQKLGGWSNPNILLKHYAGYADPEAVAAGAAIETETFGDG
jgi:integrase